MPPVHCCSVASLPVQRMSVSQQPADSAAHHVNESHGIESAWPRPIWAHATFAAFMFQSLQLSWLSESHTSSHSPAWKTCTRESGSSKL